jgi:hypothetical protein
MYEYLPITELEPGEGKAGRYRGMKTDTDESENPTGVRVFLETTAGPLAVACDARVLAKLRKLNVSDGHRIMVMRLSDSVYHVVLDD